MTLPLVVLAAFSLGVGWGWPVWDAEASYLGHLLRDAEPAVAEARFHAERAAAHEYHLLAGGIGLLMAAIGAAFAVFMYVVRDPTIALGAETPLITLLRHKWYFDEAYDATFVRPTVGLAAASAAADKRPTAGVTDEVEGRRIDPGTLDGALTAVGQLSARLGSRLRALQTGLVRQYVLVLALTVVVLLGMLTALTQK
jgi:NADH-quinone oxidoreductase subunit L